MWRKTRLAFIAVFAFAFWLGVHGSLQAAPLSIPTTRIYGETQIDTAIAVSQKGWTKADTVLIANAYHFPDALVASPLSHKLDAPILLNPVEQADPDVLKEIQRLGAKKVILLGGEAVLSDQVRADLVKAGLTVDRIWGYDAYETAAKVAEQVSLTRDAILVSGEQFPDALSVSAYAGATETPILLTKAKEMPAVTKETLNEIQTQSKDRNGITGALVVGGEAVVSSSTLTGVQNVTRVAGFDRYETAADVYNYAKDTLNASTGYVVTGEQFPDALVAGALAAKNKANLFMSAKNELPAFTYSALQAASGGVSFTSVLIGGPAVLTDQVVGMINGSVAPKYLLAGLTIVVDPGHGGPDPGACGATGTYEKNNTLAVGLNLAYLLRAAGAQVIMTRTDDTPPTGANYTEAADLKARVAIANDNKADLFISIHNDSFSDPSAGGTTTIYCSQNPSQAESQKLGKLVQAELVKELGLRDRGVKDSLDYVVRYTNMPAILVEVGFISNPTEEKLLGSPNGQQTAAHAIYEGVLAYEGW